MRRGASAALAYSVVASVAFWHDLPFNNLQVPAAAPDDTTAVAWFLSYVGFAVTHGHNPFFTNWMDFPSGVNLPANQSMILLGALLTPITILFGPLATLNFTLFAALVTTALAMYVTLRYFDCRPLAAFAGGLLFGFGPLQVAHSLAEPIFTFLPAVPLIFLLTYRLASDPVRCRPRRDGLLLGLLCGLQLYIDAEPLVDILVAVAVTIAVTTAWRGRKAARARALAMATGMSWAAATFLVLALPFLYYYLAGPQHVNGPELGLAQLAVFHTDLAGVIAPNKNMLLGPASVMKRANLYAQGTLNESGAYLGIPLVLVSGALAWRERRSRLVRFSSVVALTGFVLSLGPVLWVNNHDTGLPLPGRLLTHLPLLQSCEPALFFVGAELGIAVILGVGLTGLAAERAGGTATKRAHGFFSTVAVGAVAAFALVPLTPNWPNQVVKVHVPPYFTTPEVDAISPGATVLTYPQAGYGAVQPMQWQMDSGFRFKIVSGFAYVANDGGVPLGSPPMVPQDLSELERYAYGLSAGAAPLPAFNQATFNDIRVVLAKFGVNYFIALPVGHYQLVSRYVSAALGQRPQARGGVLVWPGVHGDVQGPVGPVLAKDRSLNIISADPQAGNARP